MTRGYVIPIGGAEERVQDGAILARFVRLCGGREGRIAIIPTASQSPDAGEQYEELFRQMGARRIRVLKFEERADCEDPEHLSLLERANGVFLTGGNQLRLSTTLGGTPVADLLRRRQAEDGLHVAGTSAGASILSEHMIAHGEEGPTPASGKVALAPGLGIVRWAIVDQHFRQRDRLGRLLAALAYNPRLIGLGIDEDAAAVIAPDDTFEVEGSGAVTVVDATGVEFSSIDAVHPLEPVTVIGVHLHVLTAGASFDLESRGARPPRALSPR